MADADEDALGARLMLPGRLPFWALTGRSAAEDTEAWR